MSFVSILPVSLVPFWLDLLDFETTLLPGLVPPVNVDANLALDATDGHGHALFGSGNPAAGWDTVNAGTIQLGSEVTYRQGDTAQPISVHGDTVNFNMPAGPQVIDLAHGVTTANAARDAFSFNYAFSESNVGPKSMTLEQFLNSGGEFIQRIGFNGKVLDLEAVYDPVHNPTGSHIVWETMDSAILSKGTILIADDSGNQYTTQNSQNPAFYPELTGATGDAGTWTITDEVVNLVGQPIAVTHNVIHAH